VVSGSNYGTGLTGTSFQRVLSLGTGLGYLFNVYFYDNTTCTVSGEMAVYTQSGNYAIGSLTTTPSGATQIQYTVTQTQLTVYAGTSGAVSLAAGVLAGNLNSDCGGSGFSFSTTAQSSVASNWSPYQFASSSITCNTGNLSLPTFYDNGTVFYDVVLLNSATSPTTFTVSPNISIFHPGQFSTYPTTASEVYAY